MASKKTQGSGVRAAKKATTKATATTSAAKKAPAKVASKASTTSKAQSTSKSSSATKKTGSKASRSSASSVKTSGAKTAKTAKNSTKNSTTKAEKASSPSSRKAATGRKAAALRVRSDESPWTPEELDAVRGELLEQQDRLRGELEGIEQDIQQLMRDSGDGSGDDDVDTGAKTSGREQEFTVARNSQAMLDQADKALHAIEDGTYGVCESCGKPIGKLRMQAQPRATLCVACKQQQERH